MGRREISKEKIIATFVYNKLHFKSKVLNCSIKQISGKTKFHKKIKNGH